jgi:hypothetical protein
VQDDGQHCHSQNVRVTPDRTADDQEQTEASSTPYTYAPYVLEEVHMLKKKGVQLTYYAQNILLLNRDFNLFSMAGIGKNALLIPKSNCYKHEVTMSPTPNQTITKMENMDSSL